MVLPRSFVRPLLKVIWQKYLMWYKNFSFSARSTFSDIAKVKKIAVKTDFKKTYLSKCTSGWDKQTLTTLCNIYLGPFLIEIKIESSDANIFINYQLFKD